MRELEFLPDWYPRVRRRRRMVVLQAWVTLVLFCGMGLWILFTHRNVHAREVTVATLRTDLTQSEAELQRLEDLLQLQRALGQQDAIFARIGRPVAITKVLTTLEQLMPRDMAILDLTIDSEESSKSAGGSLSSRMKQESKNQRPESKLRFRLHGVAPTDVDLADFILKLTGKPFFNQVELMYSHERPQSGHIMREFEVTFIMDVTPAGGK